MTVRLACSAPAALARSTLRPSAPMPGAKLVAVADAMAEAANAIAAAIWREVRTIDAILASADIDAVVICTPTDTHADLIERFARAGKAIFCEKPVDLDIKRVKACIARRRRNLRHPDGRLQPPLRPPLPGRTARRSTTATSATSRW